LKDEPIWRAKARFDKLSAWLVSIARFDKLSAQLI
jgi:hypothetical protein